MKLFTEIFSSFINKNRKTVDKRSDFIYYKIVDSVRETEYSLQCINTNAVFHANITDLIFDIDILYGLHPIQACYIGVEYAKYIKKINLTKTLQKIGNHKLDKYSVYRYGIYNLYYQNRQGDLCFINVRTNNEYIMDPRDIALSEELIGDFDAPQAFFIGLQAGLKINNPTKKYEKQECKRPLLHLVK